MFRRSIQGLRFNNNGCDVWIFVYIWRYSVMTTNLLNANCKLNEHGYYWHSDMTKELAKTPLAEDLSIMLKKYNRRVKRISCQEGILTIPKEAMLDSNISKDLSIPDTVWEVSLYIKLEPLQQK